MAGVEERVLCFGPLSTDKICADFFFFFKRMWEESLYYIHKQYSLFFRISNLSKVHLWAKLEEWLLPVSQMGTGQETSSLRHLGIGTCVLPKSSVQSLSSSLAVAVRDLNLL